MDPLDALQSERTAFFEAFNRRYAELREDEAAWSAIEDERAIEEGAVRDQSR